MIEVDRPLVFMCNCFAFLLSLLMYLTYASVTTSYHQSWGPDSWFRNCIQCELSNRALGNDDVQLRTKPVDHKADDQ
jgi:hypothetical protein